MNILLKHNHVCSEFSVFPTSEIVLRGIFKMAAKWLTLKGQARVCCYKIHLNKENGRGCERSEGVNKMSPSGREMQ